MPNNINGMLRSMLNVILGILLAVGGWMGKTLLDRSVQGGERMVAAEVEIQHVKTELDRKADRAAVMDSLDKIKDDIQEIKRDIRAIRKEKY